MDNERQTPQVDQQNALFNKFYENGDLTPDQLQAEEATPAPMAAASTEAPAAEDSGTTAPPSTEEASTTEAAAVTPPSQTISPDPNEWLAKLPADVRERFEQTAKQAEYWQRKQQEQASKNRKLHNELAALQKKVVVPPPAPVTDVGEEDEEWKKLEEADPVLAKILKKREEALAAKFRSEADSKAREYVEPIHQEREQQYIASQLSVLDQTVPNWREVNSDPYFRDWLENSTPEVKGLYGSLNAENSIRVLQLYATDMQQYFGGQQQAAPPAQQVAAPTSQVSQVQQQRNDKLARSAPIPSQPVGQARPAQLSQEQLFKKLYENPDAILELLAKTSRS